MHTNKKRALSFVLALMMVFSFALPVFAAPESTTLVDHHALPITVNEDGKIVLVKDLAANEGKPAGKPDSGFAFVVQDCKGNLMDGAEFRVYDGGVNPVATIYSGDKFDGETYSYEWGDDVWHWGNPDYGLAKFNPDGGLKPNTIYVVVFTEGGGYTNTITKKLTFTTDDNGNLSEADQTQVYTIGCPACDWKVQVVGDNFLGVKGKEIEVFNLKIDAENGEYLLSYTEDGKPGQYQPREGEGAWLKTVGPTDNNGFATIRVEHVRTEKQPLQGHDPGKLWDIPVVEVEGQPLGYGEFFGVRMVGSDKVYVVNPWKINDTIRSDGRLPKVDPTVHYLFNEDCGMVTIPFFKAKTTIRVNVVANGKPDDWTNPDRIPVVGAEVALFRNATEIWGRLTKGEEMDRQVTDKHGYAYFYNVDLSEAFEYLAPHPLLTGPAIPELGFLPWADENGNGHIIPYPTPEGNVVMDPTVILPYLVQQQSAPVGFYKNSNIFQVYVTEALKLYNPDTGELEVVYDTDDTGKIIDVTIHNGTYTNAIDRIYGVDRFETAVRIAERTYPEGLRLWDGHKSVIIANGYNFPDALSGGVLTEAYEAPMLLTQANTLNAFSKAYIQRTNANRAFVLGGTASVSDAVVKELQGMGLAVIRLQGETRYDTAVAIGDNLIKLLNDNNQVKFEHGYKYDGTVFMANGENFADALTASVPAADMGTPLLLTNGNSLTAQTSDALDRWNIRRIVIIGGEASVSKALELNLIGRGFTVDRYFGLDRATTAMATAKEFYNQTTKAFVASAWEFPDALVGARLAAQEEAPILLVNRDNVPNEVAAYIQRSNITRITILGGENTVTDAVAARLAQVILGK